ncbi:unnamed protein product [Choristocarpus tenellus]
MGGREVVMALMECLPEPPLDAPLMTCRQEGGWRVITRDQATGVLRRMIKELKLRPEEHALHSGRIGEAMRSATMGVSVLVIRREGR